MSDAAGDVVLAVEGLSAGYGDVQVIWDVSFEVRRGEIVAFVGSNGAGKSTTLKTVVGVVPVMSGELALLGAPITTWPYYRRVAGGISLVSEGRALFAGLTIEENLRMGAYLRRDAATIRRDLDRVYEFFPRLAERRRQLAGTLSGGEQQMCAIGRGLMSRPRVLMIDELSLGLAPVVVDVLVHIVRRIRAEGVAVLLVEQDIATALSLADRGYVLDVGRIVLQGSSAQLLSDPQVRRAYLGV
jgi:ABC-type branched-subunit amino acid transport system ATPase component